MSAVFPTPASPRTTSTPLRPPRTAASRPSSACLSPSRSSNIARASYSRLLAKSPDHGSFRAWHGRPARHRRSKGVDLDLVGDADDAVEARHVVERSIALELELDVALERHPSFIDLHVERVRGDLRVPDQALQRDPADLVVCASVVAERVDLQLVVHVIDSLHLAGVLAGRAALGKALDGAAQRGRATVYR